MTHPKPDIESILSEKELHHYRNVRAVTLFFLMIGTVAFLASLYFLVTDKKYSPLLLLGVAAFGAVTILGSLAVLGGDRKRVPLIYAMAVLYLFCFPVGTLLSASLLLGLKRYLAAMDKLRGQPDAGNKARESR